MIGIFSLVRSSATIKSTEIATYVRSTTFPLSYNFCQLPSEIFLKTHHQSSKVKLSFELEMKKTTELLFDYKIQEYVSVQCLFGKESHEDFSSVKHVSLWQKIPSILDSC